MRRLRYVLQITFTLLKFNHYPFATPGLRSCSRSQETEMWSKRRISDKYLSWIKVRAKTKNKLNFLYYEMFLFKFECYNFKLTKEVSNGIIFHYTYFKKKKKSDFMSTWSRCCRCSGSNIYIGRPRVKSSKKN